MMEMLRSPVRCVETQHEFTYCEGGVPAIDGQRDSHHVLLLVSLLRLCVKQHNKTLFVALGKANAQAAKTRSIVSSEVSLVTGLKLSGILEH